MIMLTKYKVLVLSVVFLFTCLLYLKFNELLHRCFIYAEYDLVVVTRNSKEFHHKCNEIYMNLYKFHSTMGSEYPKKDYRLYNLNQYNNIFKTQRTYDLKVENVWLVDTDYLHIKNMTKANEKQSISNKQLQDLTEFAAIRQNEPHFTTAHLDYEPLDSMLNKYLSSNEMTSKKIALLGLYEIDYVPWIESILIKMNRQTSMILIDYQHKVYENPNIKWIFLNKYLKDSYANSIAKKISYGEYDILISHHMIDKVSIIS